MRDGVRREREADFNNPTSVVSTSPRSSLGGGGDAGLMSSSGGLCTTSGLTTTSTTTNQDVNYVSSEGDTTPPFSSINTPYILA
ncbi:hypothetical protein Pmani_012406 [Petrolisthes manimaculis]|uniref:Uncharacterized protein n=1 Tax=Petrolisthes manimaculis TaxID=1843537 RepID=A0AAE1UAI7_9EUCA|nr:hypothetical protein Pmani_012406 [Petrolisthes manimaculis]